MLALCLVMLLSTDSTKIAVNLREITYIEDNVHETRINMGNRSVRTPMEYEKVVKLLQDTAKDCK